MTNPASTTCPKCEMTSHYDMDVFFKWCANCNITYGGVPYENHDRAMLGAIHKDWPHLTLEEVVDFYKTGKRPEGV